jgi:hypothetical protein
MAHFNTLIDTAEYQRLNLNAAAFKKPKALENQTAQTFVSCNNQRYCNTKYIKNVAPSLLERAERGYFGQFKVCFLIKTLKKPGDKPGFLSHTVFSMD